MSNANNIVTIDQCIQETIDIILEHENYYIKTDEYEKAIQDNFRKASNYLNSKYNNKSAYFYVCNVVYNIEKLKNQRERFFVAGSALIEEYKLQKILNEIKKDLY